MLENIRKEVSPYHECRVGQLMRTLDEKDQKHLEGYLADPDFGPIALSSALAKVGVSLSQKSIQKHKHFKCSCFRNA